MGKRVWVIINPLRARDLVGRRIHGQGNVTNSTRAGLQTRTEGGRCQRRPAILASSAVKAS